MSELTKYKRIEENLLILLEISKEHLEKHKLCNNEHMISWAEGRISATKQMLEFFKETLEDDFYK